MTNNYIPYGASATIIEPDQVRAANPNLKQHNYLFATNTPRIVARFNKSRLRSLIDNLPVEGYYMIDPNWPEFNEPFKKLGL